MSHLRSVSLFVLLAVLWGLSFPAISVGLNSLPPLRFAAFRYDVAAVLLVTYALTLIDEPLPHRRNDLAAIAGGGLFLVAGNGLLFIGQQTVPSSVAAILQSLVPILTALWAFALLDEGLSTIGAAGVGLGFLGVGLVIQPDPANLLAGDTVGRLLIVTQAASVALGGVLIQRARPTIDRVPLTGWSMLLGAVVLHGLSLGIGEGPPVVAPTGIALGAVVYLGVFSTAIAFLIYFTLLEAHGAFEAALVAYLVPVVATVVGVFVLGETIGETAVLGFGLVALGFALVKRHALQDVVGLTSEVGRP